jgi:argininosuccinate lyase
MTKALSFDLLATDLAEYLVRKGMSFRRAHDIVGQVLARAEERGVEPSELPLSELRALSAEFDSDVTTAFDFRASVERRDSEGGVSSGAIDAQIRKAEEALAR